VAIRHLKHTEIDFDKYDACVKKANNYRVYALSWYLNTVTNKDWEILILDDYKAVMPLPYSRIKRKFLKRLIVQPMFCQQLGVFSMVELNVAIFNQFLKVFKVLKSYTYNFNSDNTDYLTSDFIPRNNFELNLETSYEQIQKKYSKNLKRNLKKSLKNVLSVTNNVTMDAFILMKDFNKKHSIKSKQYKVMRDLVAKLISENFGTFYAVKKETDIIAIAFFVETNDRLIHLFSTNTTLGKQVGAIPFLFDSIIKKNANQNCVFDFEGSMIEGVAQFFKSFGAENNAYLTLNNSN